MNPKTPTPVRAVVVDDVDVMRQLLRLLLERGGQCTVVAEADNGQSGVTAVLAHRPDLVLLDVTMPGMDGVQALKLIRSQVPSAVVVMLSTWETTSRQANTCTALGAHGFLRKDGNIHLVPDEVGAIVRATRSLGEASSGPHGAVPVRACGDCGQTAPIAAEECLQAGPPPPDRRCRPAWRYQV